MKLKLFLILSLFLGIFTLISCGDKKGKQVEQNNENAKIIIYAPSMHEWFVNGQKQCLTAKMGTLTQGTDSYSETKMQIDSIQGKLGYLSNRFLGASLPELFKGKEPGGPLPPGGGCPEGPEGPIGPFPVPFPCNCTIPLDQAEVIVPAAIQNFKLRITTENGEVIGGFSKDIKPVTLNPEGGFELKSYDLDIWGKSEGKVIIEVSSLSGYTGKMETYRIMAQLASK